ncbi:MAG: SUF system Fe-S cluster assembly regulator [Thermoanaerobaculia bacterium]|nr:SUF system Fe-S cluster assembly regulator [Thermoanaerobaculia bacterium]
MTKQADYGIVLLTRMAPEPARLFTAAELAEETQLPQPTASKILKLLARGGLLLSQRGVHGGYSLSRAPEEISVAEVIGALDGPIAITECIDDGPGECSHERLCPVRGNWQRINLAIRRALEGISLAEMSHPLPRSLVTLGGGRETHPASAR